MRSMAVFSSINDRFYFIAYNCFASNFVNKEGDYTLFQTYCYEKTITFTRILYASLRCL